MNNVGSTSHDVDGIPNWFWIGAAIVVAWLIVAGRYSAKEKAEYEAANACPHCGAGLINSQITERRGTMITFGWIFGVIGAIVLFFVYWLGGLIMIAIGLILARLSTSTVPAIVCPACRKFSRRISA